MGSQLCWRFTMADSWQAPNQPTFNKTTTIFLSDGGHRCPGTAMTKTRARCLLRSFRLEGYAAAAVLACILSGIPYAASAQSGQSTASTRGPAKRTTCTQWWQFCTEGVQSRGGAIHRCDDALPACLSTGVWDPCSAPGGCGFGKFGQTVTGLTRK
jgi:hypothetical protein